MLLKKIFITLVLFFLFGSVFSQNNWKKGRLKVTPNGHFLQYEDGTPFFWLGDTGWEMFSRLNKEEIERYLENRREKGFNVIQAVAIANTDKPLRANQYGDFPLEDNDPTKPNEQYFQLIDWTIQLALKKNMFIGLLPTWGGNVSKLWSEGKVLFNEENAYKYGLFLGERYKDYPNIIWIAGGDRPAFVDSMDWRPVWRSMIRGIREGTKGKALVTYHPAGESSSTDFWKGENTIDLNMLQSGHARHDIRVWDWITRDYNQTPAKPVLDGEPNYEDHPVNWKPKNGYFRDYDVRKQLYRSVFAGGCGVTYGHQAIWQFYSQREEKISFPDRYWTEAMDRPGAFQAGYLKSLMESRPLLNRLPDQDLILNGQGENGEHITAFRDHTNLYAMVYLPVGKKIQIDVSWISSDKMVAWWFNPRTNESQEVGVFNKRDKQWFVPPTLGMGNDWVLILDDASKKWPTPGDSLPLNETMISMRLR